MQHKRLLDGSWCKTEEIKVALPFYLYMKWTWTQFAKSWQIVQVLVHFCCAIKNTMQYNTVVSLIEKGEHVEKYLVWLGAHGSRRHTNEWLTVSVVAS